MLAQNITPGAIESDLKIHLHVRFRGGQTTSHTITIPAPRVAQRATNPNTLTLLDRLLDKHADTEAAGSSTKPATAPATANHSPTGSCSNYAAATNSPAITSGSAPAAYSRSARPPNGSECTPAPSTPGTAPG